MQFGKVENPENIDFTLPKDHQDTHTVFDKSYIGKTQFYIGCAKWNRQDLKGFYPRGTKDELTYYSSQFNSIELNATFYNLYPKEQFIKWSQKTPDGFKFYPKITKDISHHHQLDSSCYPLTETFINNAVALKDKLGSIFLQMNETYEPSEFYKLKDFISTWPTQVPLVLELRHPNWYQDNLTSKELYQLLQENNLSNIITDTAGRRDLLHMRLTCPHVFIRFVGSNHISDYHRLDDWIDRIEYWTNQGISSISFFIHQNIEKESVLLSSYFIKNLNKRLSINLKVPSLLSDDQSGQQSLF